MKCHPEADGSYPDTPRPAVGAVVFKDDAVLLVQRAKAPAMGMWAVPGGSVRLGETLQAAAEREVLEETGVVIRAGEPVLVFDTIQTNDRGIVQYHYVIVDLAADFVSGTPRAGDDAADARWVTRNELSHLNVNPATLHLLWDRFSFGERERRHERKDNGAGKESDPAVGTGKEDGHSPSLRRDRRFHG